MSTSIVLIHGAWLTSQSWDRFSALFTERGYDCVVPPWPHDNRPVQALQSDPAPELASLGVTEIVDHYARVVAELPEPPVLVGHSFGGLFVQMLLDRGLGRAGVAIHPAPGKGILPNLGILRANRRPLSAWRGWKKVLTMPKDEFRTLFANGLQPGEVDQEYTNQIVPTPGRVFFQAATAPFHDLTRIRYENPDRGPLLLMAGGADRIIPAAIVRATNQRHQRSPAVTELVEFEGRSHYTVRESGWEQVAEKCLEFFDRHLE